MADNSKAPIIIIKKKKGGGGHGHHGGAWKVAYADFVTAMMAFFMVMWLMGSDEETKTAIAHYFNHPNTPYKAGADPKSQEVVPLGEKTGEGDTLLKGAAGAVPEELVTEAVRPVNDQSQNLSANEELSDLLKKVLENQAYGVEVNVDFLKFSLPEALLFNPGTANLKPTATKYLERLGRIFHTYRGYVTIAGHTSGNTPQGTSAYEFSLSQAVTVMHYFVEANWAAEEKFFPEGEGERRGLASAEAPDSHEKNRRIEFTLSRVRAF